MTRLTPLAVVLLLIPAPRVALPGAQEPVISPLKCGEPREPIGLLEGEGIVRETLSPDGVPDTSQLEVGTAKGVTAAGLRSVAARQLDACRFRIQPRPSAPLLVLHRLVLASGRVSVQTIPAASRAFAPMPLEDPTVGSDTLDETDPRLEERPRELKCRYKTRPTATTTEVTTRADLEKAIQEAQRRTSGEVHFTFVIGIDGRYVQGSATVITSTNPNVTTDAVKLYEGCQYVPGRVAGVPVPVRADRRLQTRLVSAP